MERNLGYIGFLHNFKNYIIRRSDHYYEMAIADYVSVKSDLAVLKKGATKEDLLAIATIEATLATYHDKLQLAHEEYKNLSTLELDTLVKVNDVPAEAALELLRSHIIPRMLEKQVIAEDRGQRLTRASSIIALLIFPTMVLTSFITIRAIQSLARSSKEMAVIFNASPNGILYVDYDGKILRANKTAETLFGYEKREMHGLEIERLIDPAVRRYHSNLRHEFNRFEQSVQIDGRDRVVRGVKKDGSLMECKVTVTSKEISNVIRNVCVIEDVSEHNKLKEHSEKDHLTGLYNRRYFDEALSKELLRSVREERPLSLFIIDLDHFKALNDSLGHSEGDLGLQKVAGFLQNHTRPYDCLARWGGDEFVLLCPGLAAKDAANHARRIGVAFNVLELPWDNRLTLSIGVATMNPKMPMSKDGMINAADTALYAVKQQGRNGFKHIEAGLSQDEYS